MRANLGGSKWQRKQNRKSVLNHARRLNVVSPVFQNQTSARLAITCPKRVSCNRTHAGSAFLISFRWSTSRTLTGLKLSLTTRTRSKRVAALVARVFVIGVLLFYCFPLLVVSTTNEA